jgi:hypothetical protein
LFLQLRSRFLSGLRGRDGSAVGVGSSLGCSGYCGETRTHQHAKPSHGSTCGEGGIAARVLRGRRGKGEKARKAGKNEFGVGLRS